MSKLRPAYTNISPELLALAKKSRRPPTGMCDCGHSARLTYYGYICDGCKAKERLNLEGTRDYGIAGSDYHRETGRHVDTHYLEPYSTCRDKTRSNITKEINRHGMY